jgi:sigma-B regulation protein RsbU (phosphoserine phosphatase)
VLSPQELLFCYTDGVTEAHDTDGKEFSESRCLHVLNQAGSAPLSALLEGLRQRVADFTGSKLLEDDCTMLALRLLNGSGSLEANRDQLIPHPNIDIAN